MNKFVKFPLVLGIVGIICTGALSLVYEVTKDTIAYNKNKDAIDKIKVVLPNISNAEEVFEKYDTDKATQKGIQNIYEVSDSTGVIAYGYLASAYGYKNDLTFLTVLSSEEEKILGLQVVSHNETADIGGVLLKDPAFIEQFTDITFDDIYTEVDGKAGATTTLNGLLNGLEGVVSYHKTEIFGEVEVNDGVNLNGRERKALGLPEGYTMTDKTEEFKSALKENTSENVYNNIVNDPNVSILNYVEVKDANGVTTNYAYVVEGKYGCELAHGERAWQEHKFVFMFDENAENVNVVVVKSTDSLGAISIDPKAIDNWLDTNYNGKSVAEINAVLLNGAEIDFIHGATFTSRSLNNHISLIIDAHTRAYKN